MRGSLLDFFFYPSTLVKFDLDLSIKEIFPALCSTLLNESRKLREGFALKFQVSVCVQLERYSYDEGRVFTVTPWFPSEAYSLLVPSDVRSKLSSALNRACALFDNFVVNGSGWVLKQVLEFTLSCSRFKLFRGGCDKFALPPQLASMRKKPCIAISGVTKDKCFDYCVVAGLLKLRRNPARLCKKYTSLVQLLPFSLIPHPVTLTGVKQFESLVPISVNVFSFSSGSGHMGGSSAVYPLYISNKETKHHVDLLLYRKHYFLIRNLSALVSHQVTVNRRKKYVCHHCLSCFSSFSKLKLHSQLCSNDGQVLQPPSSPLFTFSNFRHMLVAPFVIYCDFETLIAEPVLVENGKTISERRHVPISFGAMTVCRPSHRFGQKPFIYTGLDCIHVLLDFLFSEVKRITRIFNAVNLPLLTISEEERAAFEAATNCFMCGFRFGSEHVTERKVLDHCHLSGRYRFPLCSNCNLTYGAKSQLKIYVVFHGLSNYDSHFIIQELHKFSADQIYVVPKNMQKFLTFSFGCLYFKDSAQFLQESLSVLANNLAMKGEEYFCFLKKYIPKRKERKLLMRKGIFPYSYCTSPEKLNETSLPPVAAFTNDLTGEEVSDCDYRFAQTVWSTFGCKTLGDYMRVYLLTDVLLLADVFENFRSNCLSDYSLDPVHYFSSPHFTLDAFLRFSKVTLELLSDVNMFLLVERGIRGGLNMVSKRYSKANNKYMPDFNPESASVYIVDLDANNLYGKAMQDTLPHSQFRWMSPEELCLGYIMSLEPDGEYGCIVDCTLEYPSSLHDSHSDYPLAPCKRKVSFDELSPLQRFIMEKHNLKSNAVLDVEKLLSTLETRDHYVVHFKNLQLYVQLGMVVKAIHGGIHFRQKRFISSYIDFNSKRRAQATNKFDVNFYKLLNNGLYGKTIENPKKRTKVKLCNEPAKFEKLVAKPEYKGAKKINSSLVTVEMKPASVKLNKPFIVGMAILDLSKYHMFKFHYGVVKKFFDNRASLLYTDTDSLLYEIKSDDAYCELYSKAREFIDFSNYPPDHPCYDPVNKLVPGTFKDECKSKIITEFVGLRSKMYSLRVLSGEEKNIFEESKAAKGVHRSVIKADLRFENYYDCLFRCQKLEHLFKCIQSVNHRVYTKFKAKNSLSSFDCKRYLLDTVHSVPYGHYQINATEQKAQEIVSEPASGVKRKKSLADGGISRRLLRGEAGTAVGQGQAQDHGLVSAVQLGEST